MKAWTLLGFLLVAAAGALLMFQRKDPEQGLSAESFLIELSTFLDRYAQLNQGRYPESLEELDLTGLTVRSTLVRDPWGREYVYERNPLDQRECRFYTLGRDGVPASERDPTEIVGYHIGGRTVWRQSLLDVPREW